MDLVESVELHAAADFGVIFMPLRQSRRRQRCQWDRGAGDYVAQLESPIRNKNEGILRMLALAEDCLRWLPLPRDPAALGWTR